MESGAHKSDDKTVEKRTKILIKNNVDPSLILRKGPTKNRYSFNIITVRTAVNLAQNLYSTPSHFVHN